MKLVAILFILSISAVLISQTFAEHHQGKSGGELAGAKEAKGEKHSEHKHSKKTAKKSSHDEEKSKKGETLKEIHKKDDEESGGKKTKHHSEGGHKSSKKHGGASEHGAKFQEGAKQKKTAYKKGYREKYHKDEQKKHDSFYSKAHSSGDFEIYGQKHAKYNKHVFAKKQLDNHKAAKDENDYKKAWMKVGGHNVSDKKGHKDAKTSKSHHNNQESWAKKGGKKGGKQYKYKIPPHK